MISASLLFMEAAECASHAIAWRYDCPGGTDAPFVAHGEHVNLAHAIYLIEWAGKEDHPSEAVTVAVGQAVRLAMGGSRGLGWMRILRDTVDVLRDYSTDLEAME